MEPLIEQEFENLLGERIVLRIENKHVKSQRICVRRMNINVSWFLKRYFLAFTLLFSALRSILPSTAYCLLITLLLTISVTLVFNIFPVIEECISVLNNLDGFEHEVLPLFGFRRRCFIASKQFVINEGITMQRCIFYLVAIPSSMQPYVLSHSDSSFSIPHNPSLFSGSKLLDIRTQKTIPLFLHVLPRLDCLKVIYRHVHSSDKILKSL